MPNNIADDNTPYKRLVEQATGDVPSADAGGQNVFIDSADHLLKRKNSSGVVVIIGEASIVQDWKASVRVATTANITLSGAQTIDGISVIAGDRVLVKDQSTGADNGIYVCAAGAWSRATDFDASTEVTAGTAVPVEEGTANGDKLFILTTNNPITLGSTALVFSAIGSGGGAATTNEYVTTATTSDLSAEVAIPGLAGSADIAGAGGAGTSEEWDTATTGLSWSPSAPATEDSDTTVKSHLYLRATDTTVRYGTANWSPAGAFDIRMGGCQIALENNTAGANAFGLVVLDAATPGNGVLLEIEPNPSTRVCSIAAYTYASGVVTQRGSSWSITCTDTVYLRITRDGSNNVSFWFSTTGKPGTYQLIATQAHTFTASKKGIRLALVAANGSAIADWMRTSV